MNQKTFITGLIALIGFGICLWQVAPYSSDHSVVQASIFGNFISNPGAENTSQEANAIQWMSWSDAVKANKANPKKIIVDVYTDWCGWCKRMDATTFKDPEITAYIAKNFYAVKLNAEQKEDITYDGHVFSFKNNGSRGVHELAASILDNRLSYPSVVYFNGNMERIMISSGYKAPEKMLQELRYANGEAQSAE